MNTVHNSSDQQVAVTLHLSHSDFRLIRLRILSDPPRSIDGYGFPDDRTNCFAGAAENSESL